MNKREFANLFTDYHDLDEIVIMTPGNNALIPVEIDAAATNKTGKITLITKWPEGSKRAPTEIEKLEKERAKISRDIHKKKVENGTAKKRPGRPKKTA